MKAATARGVERKGRGKALQTSWPSAAAKKVPSRDRLVGLVVKASASRAEGPGFESR